MKIAGMASSSKRTRTSSSNKSSADDARVISIKRPDTLPRNGVASAGRRKPLAESSLDVPTELVAKAVAGPKKRVRRPEQTETVGSRTRTPRAAGRASVKPKKAAAKVANDESAMTVAELPAMGAPAAVETEIVVEASAILEETTIAMPVPPLPHAETRGLVGTVSRLFSSLRRWVGPRL
jgi:hypothetical protein